jgi:ankyrin repeat protein
LAASCGFNGLVKHLITAHAPDVNTECIDGFSPLRVASFNGQVDCTCFTR